MKKITHKVTWHYRGNGPKPVICYFCDAPVLKGGRYARWAVASMARPRIALCERRCAHEECFNRNVPTGAEHEKDVG